MKESFIMHNSFYEPIKTLKNEQLGKLLRAIFNYTTNGEITQDNDILVAFMFIKNQIDMDTNKWEEQKQKRSEAGKKGMASRWNNKDNTVIDDNNKNKSVINDIRVITDNDNVNVNDNDNVNKEEIYKEESKQIFKKPSISEIEEYCKCRNNDVDAKKFYDYYEANNWKDRDGKKLKSWKQKVITWEGRKKKIEDGLPKWFDKEFKKQDDGIDELNKLLEGF